MILVGDTHGLRDLIRVLEKGNITGQNIVHVGDFGLGFMDIGRDVLNLIHLDDFLVESGNTLYAIRGNHDNPIFWDKSKGLNLPKFHNINLVDDYTVKTIEGKNILFVGGAISIDRSYRKADRPYPTWWKDEVFNFDEERLHEAVKPYKDIDMVVTHTAPHFAYPQNDNVSIVNNYHAIEAMHGNDLKAELQEERKAVSQIFDKLVSYNKKPQWWFYGHFHSSYLFIKDGVTYKLLNINETYEVI